MNLEYWIIFRGGIRDGFQRDQVRAQVSSRLKVDARQLERIFSGQRVVLKKGLDATGGYRFLAQLQQMGMDAVLERISAEPPAASPKPPVVRRTENWMSDSGFMDFERTQLNLSRAEAVLNGNSPAPLNHPFIVPAGTQSVTPASSRQTPPTVPLPERTAVLRGAFPCSHCGTLHQLEARIQIRPIQP
ncbi:MAG: hypothetical protein H6R19_1900 [Proteobacteria bacterium]|nr:hypothetical protein [Pseudomonadota bacterium]